MQTPSSTLQHYSRDSLVRSDDPNYWTATRGRTVTPNVLERVLLRARRMCSEAVVVFDLDSTLLNNRPRQARILREAGTLLSQPRLLGCQAEHFVSWSFAPPLRKLGFSDEEIDFLIPKVRDIWKERFFTSEYCHDDVAIPFAASFVKELVLAGSIVAYCTGRHEGMREGTTACLAREGFPIPDGKQVHLLMKPDISLHDDVFKISARATLESLGSVIAAFDNEPIHINNYFAYFQDAECVHLLTDDSGRGIAPHRQIPSVRSFSEDDF